MRRIRISVAYEGADFHGWQVQPGLATIQGVLEKILGEIEGAPVAVKASGRTDAGVHALHQVAAFDLANPIPCENLRRAINRLLPPSIRVFHVTEAAPHFHPRHEAIGKTYEYRIWRTEICPPFERRYVHLHPYPLDEARMMRLARVFEGTHNFRLFAAADERYTADYDMRRTIFASVLSREGDKLIYRVTGSGFLKHMVRNMVGTLIECGRGNIPDDAFPGVSGPTAPACGLFLVDVRY